MWYDLRVSFKKLKTEKDALDIKLLEYEQGNKLDVIIEENEKFIALLNENDALKSENEKLKHDLAKFVKGIENLSYMLYI